MAKKQTKKGALDSKKDEETPKSDVSKLFNEMLDNLYRESALIRRKSEISSRTLSIRFGSDY